MRKPMFIGALSLIACAAILLAWTLYVGPALKVWRLEEKARTGDAGATFDLYRHYLEFRNDANEATKWLKHGAEIGDRRLQYMYASVLASNSAKSEALCWFSRAAEQGDTKSWLRLAEYASDAPAASAPTKELFELSAHAGSVTGALRFATEAMSGTNIEDLQIAYSLLQKAVIRTHPNSVRRKEIEEILPRIKVLLGDNIPSDSLNFENRASPSTRVDHYLDSLCT